MNTRNTDYVTEIIIHCTATKNGVYRSQDTLCQEGYTKPNYHVLIQPNGKVELVHPFDELVHHCKGHNLNSIGIALVGGLDNLGRPEYDNYTPAQIASLVKSIRRISDLFPSTRCHILRHSSVSTKNCPCMTDSYFMELEREIYNLKH